MRRTEEELCVAVQTANREMQRMAVELEIKSVARRQLAQEGVQDVTLRAIAREMGITAPALYRYFPSLDDLVSAMCVDLAEEVTDAVGAAVAQAPDPGRALLTAVRTFRSWAVGNRNEFALLFGQDDARRSRDSTVRFAEIFFSLAVDAWASAPHGAVVATAPATGTVLDTVRLLADDRPDGPAATTALPPEVRFVVARSWVRLAGLVSLEVSGQLGGVLRDVAVYFESELEDVAQALGITSSAA